MQINKKRNTITLTGFDLLTAMENAKTPLNPFFYERTNNATTKKNKTKSFNRNNENR